MNWRSVLWNRNTSRAFTLLELLVVVGIVTIMLVLVAPAFNQIKSSRDLGASAYEIAAVLEGARSYAVANNTYAWVGFFEEDPTAAAAHPTPEGVGRIVLSAVASSDGTRIYTFRTTIDSNDPPPLDTSVGRLLQIGKLVRLQGMHMPADLGSLGFSNLGNAPIKDDYHIGHANFARHPAAPDGDTSVLNPTTFSYPLPRGEPGYKPDYTFLKIIEFNPRGEARKIVSDFDGPIEMIAIGLRAARGNVADTKNPDVAAITVSGLTGASRVFRK